MAKSIDAVLIRPNGKTIMYAGIQQESTATDPPYFLAAMGGYLRDRGFEIALIDAEVSGETPEQVSEQIKELNPKLIGVFSLGSNLTASTWTMPGLSILCDKLKTDIPNIPIFAWGNHPSALPERTLREESVDYVIVGEGFNAVEGLINCLKYGGDRKAITGVVFLANGIFSGISKPSLLNDLNEIPVDGWDLFPNNQRQYRNHNMFAFENLDKRNNYGTVLASLGCPFNCSFCAVKSFSGNTRKMRYKTVERILKEIDWWVMNRNVYYLRFLDECFTINRNFVIELCKQLKERNYNLSIWVYSRIDTIDEELMCVMREAGIKWLGLGIESASNRVLKLVGKEQYDYKRTKKVIELTKQTDISVIGNIMFGLPGERKEDMQADLQMLRELNVEYPNMYTTMAYPGSRLYDETLKNHPERLPKSWAGYAQLSYETMPLATDELTASEILAFRDYAFRAFFDNNESYFNMIKSKFGSPAVDEINKMLSVGNLKRKILGD